MVETSHPQLVVFSGGTGGNAIVSAIQAISNKVTYVLPVSDNGGSTSEILRVLGGIGVGDLRSRLIRLIPDSPEHTEMFAIKRLLSHRLPVDSSLARHEWLDIVEGLNELWHNISNEKGQTIRSFLRIVNSELVKRARPSNLFDFSTGAIGNLFLTGMRLFFGSIESAIFLFASITGIDSDTKVLPILNTSYMTPIAALLMDDSIIAGQNAISHPSAFSAVTTEQEATVDEDANLPGSLSSLRRAGIAFDKDIEEPLPSRIREVYYINPYGQRMTPKPNARVVESIKVADAIVFAPGSLYTSIWPLLIPSEVGLALRACKKMKVVLLNGELDRETPNYSAVDFLLSMCSAISTDRVTDVCTHLIYTSGKGAPKVNDMELTRMGVKCLPILGEPSRSGMRYKSDQVEKILSTLLVKNTPMRRSTITYRSSGTRLD